MSRFLFTYRTPNRPLAEVLAELDEAARADRIAAWNGWFEDMADRVVERGKPVADARAIGNCGEGTRIGGYSIVTAKDLQEAVEVAKGCPGLEWGGGVEVGEFMELAGLAPSAASTAVGATSR
jgi:hypothetical protein